MKRLTPLILLLSTSSIQAVEVTQHRTGYSAIALDNAALVATSPDQPPVRLTIADGRLLSTPLPESPAPSAPSDMLHDGRVVHGTGRIRSAWLGGATVRYGHGILGDRTEASRLYAIDDRNTTHRIELGPDRVFEDLFPRIADPDGDGEDELLLIRSDLAAGAAVASYGLDGDQLTLEAAAAPIGTPFRWLNVVGVADFDGDGSPEIAAVVTPHIGGTLTLYRQRGSALEPVMTMRGFSNHRIGSRELGMSAIFDLDGDGRDDLLVPDNRRQALRMIHVRDGRLEEFARIDHHSEISSGLYRVELDGLPGVEIVYLLADGTLVVLHP